MTTSDHLSGLMGGRHERREAPPFDTRSAAAEIRDAGGFSQKQAEAIVSGIDQATTNLVTRSDLDQQTAELRTEIHKAINTQTWRFMAAMGAMLGLLRWLFPTGPVA